MRLFALALWIAAAGCDGAGSSAADSGVAQDDATIDAQGEYAITIAPTSLTLPIASSGTVDVTITRTNHGETITLAASAVPAGVTVSFDPPTLVAGVDTSVATVAIEGGIAGGSAPIAINATAGGLEKSATLDLAWHGITVTGKVRSGQSHVTVGLVGKPSVETGSGGTFTFTDVTPPYDLYTVTSSIATNVDTVHYYQGLTRPDPIVVNEPPFFSQNMSAATINGNLTGGNGAANRWVGWGDTGGSTTNVTTSSYGNTIAAWPQASSKTGFVHAIMWTTKASGGPDQIVYGSTMATLTSNGTFTVGNGNPIDVTLSTATTATITGTLTPPATFPEPDVTITQHFGSNSLFMYQDTANGVLDANVPVIVAGKANVYAVSRNAGAASFVSHPQIDASIDASFLMPAPATLGTPADSANGVNLSTDFTWTAAPSTVNVVTITTTQTPKVTYVVYTHGTSIRIPNVSEVPLPSLKGYEWSVSGYGPHTHVNEVATEAGPRMPSQTSSASARHTYTATASRTFTSQ